MILIILVLLKPSRFCLVDFEMMNDDVYHMVLNGWLLVAFVVSKGELDWNYLLMGNCPSL